MGAFYRSIDTILRGRKTYELGLAFQKQGIKGPAFDPKVKNYVFSHHSPQPPAPGVQSILPSAIHGQSQRFWGIGERNLDTHF